MTWTKTKTVIVAVVALFLIAGFVLPAIAKKKLRAANTARMKMRRELSAIQKAVVPALMKYAKAHEDELPSTLEEIQEYLPPNSGIDDDHWQLLAHGKLTPQLSQKDVILVRQKNVPPGKLMAIGYTDGHFEYKKQM